MLLLEIILLAWLVVQCGHFFIFVKVDLSNPFILQLSLLDVIKLAQLMFWCTLLAGRVRQGRPAKAQGSAGWQLVEAELRTRCGVARLGYMLVAFLRAGYIQITFLSP